MIIQPIVNIAEICAQHKIDQAVICPGSRSAPLTLAFARHPGIKTFIIPDERSAGFIGLGLAQSSNKPVAIICTSGTAAANLYPAIIEAFYQNVPLIVLTADRPPEWIDQQDGQTIRQQNMFQNHVLGSYQFPVSFDCEEARWHSEKMISEAIIKATGSALGPVHINIPIREPFYPSPEEDFHYSSKLQVVKSPNILCQPTNQYADGLVDDLKKYDKIMVVVGQTRISDELIISLNQIQKKLKWVIIGDITANLSRVDHSIGKHDVILEDVEDQRNLSADLLISFGQSVLSKKLKNFLRNEKVMDHWHIGFNNETIDPFKSLTKNIELNPEVFFRIIEEHFMNSNKKQNAFYNLWVTKELQARTFINDFFNIDYLSEFHAVQRIISQLPSESILHLANSMPVRYANILGIGKEQEIEVWANRGTSGIDGCLSTSLGHAINNDKLNVLLIGDIAFFYDRNGLWHNHMPDNLRIIILNNHGGGIFRLLNGPKQLDELETFFETQQKLNAANTARDFGMKYFAVKTPKALPDILKEFFNKKTGSAILEIETEANINQQVFEKFKLKAAQLWK